MKQKDQLGDYVNFLHEVGMLAHTPRSGFPFLGSGQQSVAEHSFRVAFIGYTLAKLIKDQKINEHKLMMMCLLHDLPEARTGDLNHLNKKYVQSNEAQAVQDIRKAYPFGEEIATFLEELKSGQSLESKLAHDADKLELLLFLRREQENGNTRAPQWFARCEAFLETDCAKDLAKKIHSTPSDAWYLGFMA